MLKLRYPNKFVIFHMAALIHHENLILYFLENRTKMQDLTKNRNRFSFSKKARSCLNFLKLKVLAEVQRIQCMTCLVNSCIL